MNYLLVLDQKKNGYMKKFILNENIFTFAPISKIIPNDNTIDNWTALQTGDYEVNLRPIFDLADGMQPIEWNNYIRFNPFEVGSAYSFVDNAETFKGYYRMHLWAARCKKPLKLSFPIDPITNQPVPHGSILDFDIVPACMQFIEAMVLWLRFRGFKVPTTFAQDRREIIALVNQAIRLSRPIDTNAMNDSIETGHYITFDKLFTIDPVSWVYFDSADLSGSILLTVRNKILSINIEFIDRIFGERRNGIRWRALRAVKSGNYFRTCSSSS